MNSASATLPLLAERDLSQPLAWRAGQAISAAQFLAQAQALALDLPDGRPVNLCQDRYHFALAFAAALLRGQTSLMPPNALPQTLQQLPRDGGEPYLLVDDAGGSGLHSSGLRAHHVSAQAGLAPLFAVPAIAADLPAVCLLTSGSTGAPQPHVKRWGSLVSNIAAQAHRLAQMLQRADLAGLSLVATVPAQHSYGFESSVLLALLGGACFDAGRPFYAADIQGALATLPEPRALVTTPFHLKNLLQAGLQLPPTALMLSATAPLSPQLAAQAEAALSGMLIEIYGCTEAGQVASRRTTAGEIWLTLGELRIVKETATVADAVMDAEPGAERYVVSGGHVSEPTALADLLDLQDERRFRLLGRANDLIHVAGKRSSLAHLNFHLNRIAGVEDGAFWLPDEVNESVVRPVAFVVAPTLSSAQLIEALRAQLEPAFVPRRVVHVAALPREATGKLTAAALRALALQSLETPPSGLAAGAQALSMEAWLQVADDHPAFAGHFPGHPVLPGAALLSMVMQALSERPALAQRVGATPTLANAKFLRSVGPGARLRLVFAQQGAGLSFDVLHDGVSVARGQIAPGAAL